MTNPRASYQSWLRERRNRLANARGRLSRVLSTEWLRFRRSRWPTAEQALLGLLRSSAAFLTAPLYPNYRPSFQAGSSLADGYAPMNGMRDFGEQTPGNGSHEQRSLPATEPVQSESGPRLLSGSRPVLVPKVR